MANYKKIELPKVNTVSLTEKLDWLFENRLVGPYHEDEVSAEKDALLNYWLGKNAKSEDEAMRLFNDLLKEWDHRKMETRAVILYDALTNGNRNSEWMLVIRDATFSSEISKMQKMVRAKVASNKMHIFSPLDESIILEYIFEKFFKHIGFNAEEINQIAVKYARVKSRAKMPRVLQYAYATKAMEICDYIASSSSNPFFTEESLTENIKNSLTTNDKFLIGQDPKATLTKVNFLNYVACQPQDFSDKVFNFATSDEYFDLVMLSENQFYDEELEGFANEIQLAESKILYPAKKTSKEQLPFSLIQDYAISTLKDESKKADAKKIFTRLFLNYAFGEITPSEKTRIDRAHAGAIKYFEEHPEKKDSKENKFELLSGDASDNRKKAVHTSNATLPEIQKVVTSRVPVGKIPDILRLIEKLKALKEKVHEKER